MEKERSKNFLPIILKGALLTVISATVGVMIFAFIMRFCSLPSSIIKPINQFIKILSVFIGCFSSVKGSVGFIKGALIGAVGTTLTYALFSLLGGALTFNLSFFIDVLFGLAIGLVSGILAVNVKK